MIECYCLGDYVCEVHTELRELREAAIAFAAIALVNQPHLEHAQTYRALRALLNRHRPEGPLKYRKAG